MQGSAPGLLNSRVDIECDDPPVLALKLKQPLDAFQKAVVAGIEEWGAIKNIEKIKAKLVILVNVAMAKVVLDIAQQQVQHLDVAVGASYVEGRALGTCVL